MKDYASIQTYYSGAFPNVVAVDSSGAATTDGTEYIAAQINNGIFGWQQDIMNYAGLLPDGVIEADGTGQIKSAFQLGNGVGPGMYVQRAINDTPAVWGDRVILLTSSMQGVLISAYPELAAAVYVGDPNNATAVYFYKSTDAAGTVRNTAGTYIQLPPHPNPAYLKQYSEAAGDFTVTGGSWATTRAVGIPYKTVDSAYRLIANVVGTLSPAVPTTITLQFSGVTFKNVVNYSQEVSFWTRVAGTWRTGNIRGTVTENTNQIVFESANLEKIVFSLDVELDSAPTWMEDFDYQWGITY